MIRLRFRVDHDEELTIAGHSKGDKPRPVRIVAVIFHITVQGIVEDFACLWKGHTFVISDVRGCFDRPRFLFGYGLVQAVPGPLFSFAAYLGAADARVNPALGAVVATVAIFAPSFLLLTMTAPVWNALRSSTRAARALTGLNAAVVGILAAVFVVPIAASIVRSPLAVAIAVVAFALLQFGRAPSWAVVIAGAGVGAAVASAR